MLNYVKLWQTVWKRNYPFQPSMYKNSLIEKIKRGDLFVVDCSLEVPAADLSVLIIQNVFGGLYLGQR